MATETRTQRVRNPELASWLRAQTWSEFAASLAEDHHAKGGFTPKQLQAAESMKAKVDARDAKRAQERGPQRVQPKAGFYRVGPEWFRVQWNRAETAVYAKVFDAAEKVWHYAGTAPLAALTPDRMATREQAQEFGHAHGRCVVCMAELTDPDSVSRGMGPVCYAKYGQDETDTPNGDV